MGSATKGRYRAARAAKKFTSLLLQKRELMREHIFFNFDMLTFTAESFLKAMFAHSYYTIAILINSATNDTINIRKSVI